MTRTSLQHRLGKFLSMTSSARPDMHSLSRSLNQTKGSEKVKGKTSGNQNYKMKFEDIREKQRETGGVFWSVSCQEVVSLLLKVGGLRNHGAAWLRNISKFSELQTDSNVSPKVTLHLNINSERLPVADVPAVPWCSCWLDESNRHWNATSF